MLDFQYVTSNPNLQSNGCLQCYCAKQIEELGYKEASDDPICNDYLFKTSVTGYVKSSASYIIVLLNFILSQVVLRAVEWIGYSSET